MADNVTELLLIGERKLLVKDTPYALPARKTTCFVQGSGMLMSADGFSTFVSVTLDTNNEFVAAGRFVKSSVDNTIITPKVD